MEQLNLVGVGGYIASWAVMKRLRFPGSKGRGPGGYRVSWAVVERLKFPKKKRVQLFADDFCYQGFCFSSYLSCLDASFLSAICKKRNKQRSFRTRPVMPYTHI